MIGAPGLSIKLLSGVLFQVPPLISHKKWLHFSPAQQFSLVIVSNWGLKLLSISQDNARKFSRWGLISNIWYNGGRLGSNEWKIAQQKVSICWAFTRWLSPLPGLVTALFTPRPIWGVPRPAKTARSGWYFDWKYLHFLPRSNQLPSPRLSWNDPVIIISNVQTPSMLQLSSVLSEMADKKSGISLETVRAKW